ncbi:MAG: hypothetical protein KY475_06820 [Planctomycetes bacterium]|nr:hypothetical protein [Planctomycetota bacterium]
MSDLVVSGAGGGAAEEPNRSGKSRRNHNGARGRRHDRVIPTAEDCLDAMARLPGLLTLGVLNSAQVNAIRAIYAGILQYHQRSQARDERQGISNADVIELMRSNPAILSMLEPLLTDEQIAMVMDDVRDEDNDGQA